jgi:hypothetical protein
MTDSTRLLACWLEVRKAEIKQGRPSLQVGQRVQENQSTRLTLSELHDDIASRYLLWKRGEETERISKKLQWLMNFLTVGIFPSVPPICSFSGLGRKRGRLSFKVLSTIELSLECAFISTASIYCFNRANMLL